MLPLKFKNKFDKTVKNSKKIIITSHQNPDEDSIASVLLIYRYLTEILKLKKQIKIYYSGEQISTWDFNKCFNKINFISDIAGIVNKFDTLIVVDTPDFKKISEQPDKLLNSKCIKILIDHHLEEKEVKWDLQYINQKPSNSENLYELFFKTNKNLDKSFFETLLFGILGDTKCLKTITTDDTDTLLTVGELLKKHGSKSVENIYLTYERYTANEFKVATKVLDNIVVKKFSSWPTFAYASFDETKNLKYSRSEIQRGGFMAKELLKEVKDADWSFYIRKSRKDNLITVSFRSAIGSVDVSKIAIDLKIGGGHKLSAGARFDKKVKTINQALNIIFEYLKNNKPAFVK